MDFPSGLVVFDGGGDSDSASSAEAAQESPQSVAAPEASADPAEHPLFSEEAPAAEYDAATEEELIEDGNARLFEDTPEKKAAEGEAGEESAEEADREDDKKTPTARTVPYARLQKVVHQRNELRDENRELQSKVGELSPTAAAFEEAYPRDRFKDPINQMKWDVEFMATLEKLTKTNRVVQQAAQAVMAAMEEGEPVSTEKSPERTAPAEKADEAADSKSAAVLARIERREAAATIKSVMPANIRPSFAKLIEDHVLASTKDLSSLTGPKVVALAKKWLSDNGFGPSDILQPTKKEAETEEPTKASTKPASAGGSGKAAPTAKRGSKRAEASEEEAGPPKSYEEWETRHNQSREGLLRKLFAPA